MTAMDTKVIELSEILKTELGVIEFAVTTGYTLADAIREGAKNSKQAVGWGTGDTMCALSAASCAAKARGW